MPYMTWNVWYRSEGCRNWMDKTPFGGVSFTNIFYDAMRSVFYDENNKPGLLPQGAVFAASQDIVNNRNKGKRFGFSLSDQQTMLRDGIFKYNSSNWFSDSRLRFEGPDKGDEKDYAKTQINGSTVDLNFYNIVNFATASSNDFHGLHIPQSSAGAHELAFFTGGVVLHEVMHDHGFKHPETDHPDHTPGSDYACSLPYVAYLSVLFAARSVLPKFDLPTQLWHQPLTAAVNGLPTTVVDQLALVTVD